MLYHPLTAGSETRIWDVRTKNVTHSDVADVRQVAGIANYGPGATLFTIAGDSTVQQYDVNPQSRPTIVANAQCIPPNAPPTPPDSLEHRRMSRVDVPKANDRRVAAKSGIITDSSEDEPFMMSPLQKIVQDIDHRDDQTDDEQRDGLGPLSPASSKVSSNSASSFSHQDKPRHNDRIQGSRTLTGSEQSNDGTIFSPMSSLHGERRESVSVRSSSSTSSSRYRAPSSLRHEMLRGSDQAKNMRTIDLFPNARVRQQNTPFRLPQYGQLAVTTRVLQQEMLSIIFGWNGDVESFIRDEREFYLYLLP